MASPRIWSRFQVTRQDGSAVNLVIKQATKDRAAEVVDFVMKNFVPKENMWRASGIPKSEEAMKGTREFISGSGEMDPYVLICCVDDEADSKIVASSSMHLSNRDDSEDFDIEGEPTIEEQRLYRIIEYCETESDVFGYFDVDRYYGGWGVSVEPDYYGYGIATRLFKARVQVCEEEGVPLTGAWMTAIGSQKAATKAGYHTIREIPWEKFLTDNDGVEIENPPESIKFMVRAVGEVKRKES